MSRMFCRPIAVTSPSLASTMTGALSRRAARATAIRVSWLSMLNAPTAKCSLRLRCMRSRARAVFSRIWLIVRAICGRSLAGPSRQLRLRRARLGLRYPSDGLQEAVGVERDGVDPLVDQEGREVGVVAGRLPADADLDAGGVRLPDGVADHPFDRLVALVEQHRQLRRVAVDSEDELGQVVRPD